MNSPGEAIPREVEIQVHKQPMEGTQTSVESQNTCESEIRPN